MKPLSEMIDAELAANGAELDARAAELASLLPHAPEPEYSQIFKPGVICFRDGAYSAVSPTVELAWPLVADHIDRLLKLLTMRHRFDYWRGRIFDGATLALAYSNAEGTTVTDAGLLNLEIDEEGKRILGAMVLTFRRLNLEHTARIAEALALKHGAEVVKLWTPVPVPVVPGYRIENALYGQLQVAAVRPIQ